MIRLFLLTFFNNHLDLLAAVYQIRLISSNNTRLAWSAFWWTISYMTILINTKLVLHSLLVQVLICLFSLRNTFYLRNLSNVVPTQVYLMANTIHSTIPMITIIAMCIAMSTTLHFQGEIINLPTSFVLRSHGTRSRVRTPR